MSASWSANWRVCSGDSVLTDQLQPAFSRFSQDRLVIISAPNGARRMPDDNPGLPLTAGQIANCAKSLLEQSVSVLHLHVRDDQFHHSIDASRYADAMAKVRSAIGDELIIQVTTEAVGRFTPAEQMQTVRELRPEAVSLALRELCPDDSSESEAGRFFEWIVRENIWPQYILYSPDDVRRFESLRRKGFFADEHPFAMLVLGQYSSGKEGKVDDLEAMLATVDTTQFPWCVCCFGANENAAALHADGTGGHVRLGFENNVELLDGRRATDNAALIAQFNRSRNDVARKPATADEIRQQWLAA